MALAYTADGDYVIYPKKIRHEHMQNIKNMPHCLSKNGILHWYEDGVVFSCDVAKGWSVNGRYIDGPKVDKMFAQEESICYVTSKQVLEDFSINRPMFSYKMPPDYRECTFLRSHGLCCEAIIDGVCYALYRNRVEVMDESTLGWLPRGITSLAKISWKNGKTTVSHDCDALQFETVTIFIGSQATLIAIQEPTGLGTYVCWPEPNRSIIHAEMNEQSLLIQTDECQYIAAIGNPNLTEFDGLLNWRYNFTKSARADAAARTAGE